MSCWSGHPAGFGGAPATGPQDEAGCCCEALRYCQRGTNHDSSCRAQRVPDGKIAGLCLLQAAPVAIVVLQVQTKAQQQLAKTIHRPLH